MALECFFAACLFSPQPWCQLNSLDTQHNDERSLFWACTSCRDLYLHRYKIKILHSHSPTWRVWLRTKPFAVSPWRQPSWDKLLKSTNLMRLVGSPSPNVLSLWTFVGRYVRYIHRRRETGGSWDAIRERACGLCELRWLKWISGRCKAVVGDLYTISVGIHLTRWVTRG